MSSSFGSPVIFKLVCTNGLYGLHHPLLINVLISGIGQTHLTPYVLHFLAETVPAVSKLFIQDLKSVVFLVVDCGVEISHHLADFLSHHFMLHGKQTSLSTEGRKLLKQGKT